MRARLTAIGLFILALFAPMGAALAETFSAQDFSVDVPGTMQEKQLEGGIRAYVLVQPPVAYMVTSTPLSGVDGLSSEDVCQKVYDGMKGTGTEPGERRSARLGGLPALEADLVSGGVPGIARCAFDGKRAYLVAFLNQPTVNAGEAKRLFGSFKIRR